MKQYPDVYYTLNELADLSGYDRKGFKDRLIRVCEMYSICLLYTSPSPRDRG